LGEPGIQQATYATFLQAKELAQLRSLESVTRARDLFAMVGAVAEAVQSVRRHARKGLPAATRSGATRRSR
jgi:hypothetical protein